MLILGLQKTTLLDYPHHVASTIFTGGCNFRCPYCHNGDLVLAPASMTPYATEEIFEHLNKKKHLLDGVCITGGEPTLQPDLYDFAKQIKQLGLLVKVDSNGTNPDLLSKLISDNIVDYIAMDIKNSKSKYNSIASVKNFDISAIEESVSLLLNSDIEYEFRTTVVKELHSLSDFTEIGQWLNGAKAYYLQSYLASDNVINPIYSSYSKEELLKIKNVISPYIPNVELRGID